MKQCVLFVLLIACLNVYGQEEEKEEKKEEKERISSVSILERIASNKKVELIQEAAVKDLLKSDYKSNKEKRVLTGYQVQIFSGSSSDRRNAEALKERVEEAYEVRAYVKYDAPNIRVRVGNFRTKLEAVELKMKLNEEFPGSYIVSTRVNADDI